MEYRRIIFFGHSFVHGLWDRKGGWVQRLQKEIYSDYLDNYETPWDENYCNVFNAGITNENSRRLLSRFETDLKERKDDDDDQNLVLIQFGVNSAQIKNGKHVIPPEDFRSHIKQILKISKENAEKTIVLSEGYIDQNMMQDNCMEGQIDDDILGKYEKIKQEVCKEESVDFIDFRDKVSEEEWKDKLEDGVHPNTEGHKLIFENIKEELEST